MRKLLIGLTVVASLVFAAPAMGWDQQECDEWYDKYGTPHQDCEAPPKPPEEEAPPVVVPPVTPPVVTPPSVTPPAPLVVPPTPTPTPPVAPPAEDEVPDLTDDSPDVPEKSDRDEGEAGQTEDRRDRLNIPAAPQVQTRTVSSTDSDTLPYTGIPVGLGALLGAGLMAGGALMRRRNR